MKCPSCNKKINWIQKWHFTKGLCSRKVAPCPHCGTKLIWAKTPHRLIQFGAILVILGSCSKLFYPVKIIGDYDFYYLCAILAIVTLIPGIFLLKFRVVKENEN